MEAKVNWSKQAIEDIYQIQEFIRATSSARLAEVFADKIFEQERVLKNFPLIGRQVPEFNRYYIRELLYKQYRIIYHMSDDNRIDVVAVHHSARNLSDTSVFET